MAVLNISNELFLAITIVFFPVEIISLFLRKRLGIIKSYKLHVNVSRLILLFSAIALLARVLYSHRVPVGSMYEITLTLVVFGELWNLFFNRWLAIINSTDLEFAMTNLLLLSLSAISIYFFDNSTKLTPILYSYWLPIHVGTMILAYSFFSLAFVMSIYTLLKKEARVRSSLHRAYIITIYGYVVFTCSVIFGALWANSAWGNYWQWDPKESWALVSWLLYTTYLHMYSINRASAVPIAYANVGAYLSCIFNLFIVNTAIAGLHSYAKK